MSMYVCIKCWISTWTENRDFSRIFVCVQKPFLPVVHARASESFRFKILWLGNNAWPQAGEESLGKTFALCSEILNTQFLFLFFNRAIVIVFLCQLEEKKYIFLIEKNSVQRLC